MENGRFSGNPKTEWLSENGEDRDMRLLEAFWYTDPDGRRWEAPKGVVTNGATIPRTLWSSVGSPFTGRYRRAAIVHDIALRKPGMVRDEADSMFFLACKAGVAIRWSASCCTPACASAAGPPCSASMPTTFSAWRRRCRASTGRPSSKSAPGSPCWRPRCGRPATTSPRSGPSCPTISAARIRCSARVGKNPRGKAYCGS